MKHSLGDVDHFVVVFPFEKAHSSMAVPLSSAVRETSKNYTALHTIEHVTHRSRFRYLLPFAFDHPLTRVFHLTLRRNNEFVHRTDEKEFEKTVLRSLDISTLRAVILPVEMGDISQAPHGNLISMSHY